MKPVKIIIVYLGLAFRCLWNNKAEIDYLYGNKTGMSTELRELKPMWQYWEVAKTTTETSKGVVGSTT